MVDGSFQLTPDGTLRHPGEVLRQVLDVPKKGGYIRGLGHGGLGFAPSRSTTSLQSASLQTENDELRLLVRQMQDRDAERERREAEQAQLVAEQARLVAEQARQVTEQGERLRQIEALLLVQGRVPPQDPSSSDSW